MCTWRSYEYDQRDAWRQGGRPQHHCKPLAGAGNVTMGEMRIVLVGQPYAEPRYYGSLAWRERDVYVRHPGGGKDSRHGDGVTYLTSTEHSRTSELRVPTSDITRELVNFIQLPSSQSEPQPLRGPIRPTDLILHTMSVGTTPRLAVEITANQYLPDVLSAWQAYSTASSVQTQIDKGLGQTLIVALTASSTSMRSTGAG